MKAYLKKYGVRMGIVVAAAAFLILIGVSVRGGATGLIQNLTGIVAAPMQKVLSSTVNWFNSIYGYLYDYDSLMADNESLRTQLAEAQQSAKVVLWSSSNWSSSFTISKGRTSGIEMGDPVITEYGALVGQVTELGETWATVSTLIDVDMSVGAYVGTSGSSGMVVGEYALMQKKTAKLTFLADGAQIFVGDEVLTSGSGGAFPAGLVIGTISNVQTEAGGQIEYGIVVPQCELDALVQVFIIKDFEVVE